MSTKTKKVIALIGASNYGSAFKQMEAIDKDLAKKLPKEVAESDANHYVVALVKRQHIVEQERYETSFNLQQYGEKGFLKISKNFKVLGFNRVIVLHEPQGKPEKVVVNTAEEVTGTFDPEAERARIKAELEADKEAEIKAEVERRLAALAPAAPAAPAEENDPKKLDLSALDAKALKDFAKKNKIDITGLETEADVLNALQAWQNEKK